MDEPKLRPCGLCGRLATNSQLTGHHTVPKERGGTAEDIELVCAQCHSMIHATFTNRTLADMYNSLKLLKQAPELQGFLKWVRKQPITSKSRNKQRKRRV